MTEEEKKIEIATFRFGVIADFVVGVRLSRGDKEKLLKEKALRQYDIPYSNKSRLTRGCILKWIDFYKKGGKRIESLYPKTRSDKGAYRNLDVTVRLAIKELKREKPNLKVPAIIQLLKHKKVIPVDYKVNFASIYRFLKNENLNTINSTAIDKRRFEAQYPNEIWQSDVMHGPHIKLEGSKKKKTYLIAIIDDHSRLIIHAEFYFSEGLSDFRNCFKTAIQKRGLPQKLYIDNGSCYKALHLEQITAALGVAIKHSRPYTPQGRGKIERWFRYVRDNFLALPDNISNLHLDELNDCFDQWVDVYNNRQHSSTKEKPINRYKKNLECVRPAPTELMDYFRRVATRTVKKDRTFKLNGLLYEAPVALIDRKIEVKYHEDAIGGVEIFFDSMSFGKAFVVDPHINYAIGREWTTSNKKLKQEDILQNKQKIITGELF